MVNLHGRLCLGAMAAYTVQPAKISEGTLGMEISRLGSNRRTKPWPGISQGSHDYTQDALGCMPTRRCGNLARYWRCKPVLDRIVREHSASGTLLRVKRHAKDDEAWWSPCGLRDARQLKYDDIQEYLKAPSGSVDPCTRMPTLASHSHWYLAA